MMLVAAADTAAGAPEALAATHHGRHLALLLPVDLQHAGELCLVLAGHLSLKLYLQRHGSHAWRVISALEQSSAGNTCHLWRAVAVSSDGC